MVAIACPGSCGTTRESGMRNSWLFQGRRYEPETGFYYYRARFYDPAKGRFITRDPKAYIDGLNMYTFVMNNPANLFDPMGLADIYIIPCQATIRIEVPATIRIAVSGIEKDRGVKRMPGGFPPGGHIVIDTFHFCPRFWPFRAASTR